MSSANISSNKRIAKNTMLLYLRSLFLMIISLYTSRVILQALGVEDYGLYNVVGGIVIMFQMLNSTLSSASQRFITFALGEGDAMNIKRVFTTSLTLHCYLGLLLTVIVECIGCWLLYNKMKIPEDRLEVAFWVLQISIATMFVNVVSVPYNSTIIAHERMNAFAYISIIECISKLLIAYILIISPIDKLLLYAILMFVVALSIRMLYSLYCKRNFKETQNIRLKVDKALYKEIFSFSGWNLLGNGSMALRNQGIDILLNTQFGVVVNAAKGISNQVDNAIYQFVGNFQTAVIPQITKSVAVNDINRTKSLVYNASRYSFLLLSFFVVPLLYFTDAILDFWLTEIPDWSSSFIKLTLIYLLWDTISRLHIASILATGNIKKYQIVAGCTKLFALPICFVVLKIGGAPISGILVNVFLEIICLGERLYFTKKLLGFNTKEFIKSVILRCWFTFGIAFFTCYLLNYFINQIIIVVFPLSCIVTFLCITYIGIDKSERNTVISYITNKFFKYG